MPSYVTVHEPDTRVIGSECKREISCRWKERNISSRGVVEIEMLGINRFIICIVALGKDYEIMAMHMDGMRGRYTPFSFFESCKIARDDEVDPAVLVVILMNTVS